MGTKPKAFCEPNLLKKKNNQAMVFGWTGCICRKQEIQEQEPEIFFCFKCLLIGEGSVHGNIEE